MDDAGNNNRPCRTSRSSPCVRNTTLSVVLLFVLMTCVTTLAWLVMNPHAPIIQVTSISVSNFSVSDSELRGTYDVVFNMSNPNKKIDMFVEGYNVWLGHDKVDLVQRIVQEKEAVLLEKMKEINLSVHMVMDAKQKVIAVEWRKRKVVKLELRMEVSVGFEAGNWPPKYKLFELNCGDVSDLFFDDKDAGKLLGIGGKHDCCIV